MKIFISHSSSEAQVAQSICKIIEQGGEKCFIAPRDIGYGKEYAEEIMNGIDQSDAMVLVLSENANQSPHVLREVERAVSGRIPILVYQLEEVKLTKSLEYFLMARQWVINGNGDYAEIVSFVDGLKQETKQDTKEETKQETKQENTSNVSPKEENLVKKFFPLLIVLLLGSFLLVYLWGQHRMQEGIVMSENDSPAYDIGDTIILGTYNGEPISWRILSISENGTEAILVASNILTMKAYDAAEGGDFNNDGTNSYWEENTEADRDLQLQIFVRGNSDWETSNIRTWLNSSEEVVFYEGQEPSHQAMSENYNGYQNEAGFLCGFSEEELDALVEREVVTKGNALEEESVIITYDRVFLLSVEELEWFRQAGMSLLASPTSAAVEQDMSNWYDIDVTEYEIDTYYWWLREPVPETASRCYLVSSGYWEEELTDANVGTEGYGIRPAIAVNLEADVFNEDGESNRLQE